jgi:hypothetical protein
MDLVIIALGYKEYEEIVRYINGDVLVVDLTGTIENERIQKFYASPRKN